MLMNVMYQGLFIGYSQGDIFAISPWQGKKHKVISGCSDRNLPGGLEVVVTWTLYQSLLVVFGMTFLSEM